MSHATYLIGDVFDRMRELPDNSIDLVLTSPPFLALRSYLPEDHPDKAKEIGSEPNPAEFVDTLLALSAEWRRILAPHGSIAVELGDTFAGSAPAGGTQLNEIAETWNEVEYSSRHKIRKIKGYDKPKQATAGPSPSLSLSSPKPTASPSPTATTPTPAPNPPPANGE